ncbi:putative zinc-binding dehydrogenase [Proteiniborus sp. DW1]|uniref:alcohol dehydrogenase catalytic domain-containing protein n=1 Tax=Proteiniborus sp. DW1 TaxID=1889883 RepID=UPI00092E0B24|nr:alcohol dehydrogenase catalytic domain-containing protein [Proteiniborus sp. DW1]SCG81922.1 putative zinc-binding dehydrogenase [Proteiniborus sp. DW1]
MLGKSFKIVEPRRFDLYIENVICSQDEAIVKIDYAAICKADLRYYLGSRDKKVLGFRYPMNLLHEGVGTILLDKSNRFKPGDKVVLVPNIVPKKNQCEHCVCEIQELGENYCPKAKFASSNYNGFAREYVNYPTTNLIKISDSIDIEIAVFLELVSVALAAYRRTELNDNGTIGIWGDGILGYILSATLKQIHNKGRIVAIGKHEQKLKQFPVEKYYLIGDKEIADENISAAFECVGGSSSGFAINEIIDNLRVGGKLVLTGVAESLVEINTRKVLEKGLSMYGVTRSQVVDFKNAINLFKNIDFRIDISKLIIDIIEINTITDFYNAFESELNSKKFGKNILHFNF